MKIAQLRALVAVAQGGSFSEAALELGLSQSSVSEAVQALEATLGVRVLERGRFGARLTEVGERIVGRAREALDALEGLEQEANLARGRVAGPVRVTAFRSVASQIVPKLFAGLRRRYPEVELLLEEKSCFFASHSSFLQDNSTDVIFVTEQHPDFLGWELMRDPFEALLPFDWVGNEHGISLEELSLHSLVLSSDGDCGIRVPEHFGRHGLGLPPTQMVREDSTLVQMVAQGLGIGLLPRLAIEAPPGLIRQVPLQESLERRIFVQVRHGAMRLPSVRAFLHLLGEAFPAAGLPTLERTLV